MVNYSTYSPLIARSEQVGGVCSKTEVIKENEIEEKTVLLKLTYICLSFSSHKLSDFLISFSRALFDWTDPDGIADAQKSLGLGQEDKVRKVR